MKTFTPILIQEPVIFCRHIFKSDNTGPAPTTSTVVVFNREISVLNGNTGKGITHLATSIHAVNGIVTVPQACTNCHSDQHANIKYGATRENISKQLYSDEWRAKYESDPIFEVKLLDKKYGYILMPRIITLDNSAENLRKIAQPLYDEVAKLKLANTIKGWVIDLRFTTGGNSAPMILA